MYSVRPSKQILIRKENWFLNMLIEHFVAINDIHNRIQRSYFLGTSRFALCLPLFNVLQLFANFGTSFTTWVALQKQKVKPKHSKTPPQIIKIRGCFGSRNGVVHVHHLLASHFFVWFVEWHGWMIYLLEI